MLVVQHQADCPPALLGLWLDAAGCALDVRHPYAGEPLPSGLDEHDALLVLGGSMGAYDDTAHPWLTAAKELVRIAADRGVPTLGVCLGHQLAAVALGGAVEVNPHGRQLGVLPMGWTDAASDDPVLAARPGRVIHWNNDVVADLPTGATTLALAPDGTVQAARLAPAVWGVQPHPEVDDAVVARWAADEREEIGPAVLDAALADMRSAVPELARAWQPVATAFAQRVRVTSQA
ncbi:type 1 glutamine amidotransferase [Nocardioides pocheonensis]|uniref:Type 1 glutamine amidotransferase n=1 Tax=Nocardioides pocheonensis TaxID=661485 RepID=A0A3N0GNE6_9ACTN|nr:type 1 glutamine amidotransferase [Nocardioides pocheonensis]